MATQTTNYSLDKPEVGGDAGVWGGLLNDNFDTIDTTMQANEDAAAAAQSTADDALPKAGGVLTGEVDVLTARSKRVDLGNINSNTALDLDLANVFTANITGALDFSFSNVPSGGTFALFVVLHLTGTVDDVTWPASVEWPDGGAVPDFTGDSVVVLMSFDGGTSWKGAARTNFT